MLKALELAGFKSFADRTRFEFPPGITVIVGPNGSGKSNVVDAIKWVLGEQSVKNLRGREMTDVIFNGSGSRRAGNAAEITLTLDNSKRLLPIDAPEVHITRRVYRGGEGEYLINRAPARLRDIRDLLSGTGMGTQAYSVIEQGKVDVLLQSSPRDRRILFEEAAGISRFKLRKVEALRRLERVDQNLLRLSDIIDEVENRLRGVRNQAGKARRYKEYADRLQELRIQVGLVDWRRLSRKLGEIEAELQSLGDQRDAATVESETRGAALSELDEAIGRVHEMIRGAESQMAAHRERIAAAESTIEHERRRGADLEDEIARYRRQLAAMSLRAGDVQQQWHDAASSLDEAEANRRNAAKRLVEAERALTEVMSVLDQLRGEHEQLRAIHLLRLRRSAELGNETSALESRSAEAEAARRRCDARLEELERALDDSRRETENLLRQRDGLTRRLEHLTARLEESAEQIDALCRQRNLLHDDLTERRERHSGAVERAALLEDLIRRHDGIGEGVRNVLARAANPKDVFHRNLFGLTADALQAGVDMAPLIEIALGPAAQHVAAVFDAEFLQALRAESPRLGGRVGFIPLDSCPAENDSSSTADSASEFIENATPKPAARDSSSAGAADEFPEGRPGVVGRADRFVETSPQCAALAERLLGRTWIVENLDYALQFARSVRGGYNFVTLAGERLDADGTLMIGPRDAAGGLIARRSQLRAIQAQLVESQAAIEAVQNALGALDEQIDARRRQVEQWSAEHREASEALAENRVALTTADERRNQFQRQQSVLEAERSEADARLAEVRLRLDEARGQRARLDAELRELEGNLSEIGRRMDGLENRRQTAGRETTEIKVELAQCEERLRNLQARMKQFEESRQERRKALDDAVGHLADCARRADDSQWKILQAEAEVAALYLAKENVAGQIVALAGRREAMQEQRTALAAEIQHLQSSIRKLEERIHAVDLAANEVRHERNALADRLREDYGTELAELDRRPSNDEEQRRREEVQREIEELRGKLNSLGNVNLEALAELEELEKRFQTLSDQRNDLTSAKASLESIIARIDDDSRRLFSETLEVVKGHFQTLFRDLFGGGRADIVLEENVDILESGIEIVARPPGKEPRSISLLSGGEKTLTCAALLLAIFRSRPSPFCVLDEVDAALDEANIDRFTQVLKDFLAWTQFIIVTHSKKTMTCANTIYGVTMQESGVSKQVSVRFEDVSDDGRILGGAPDESRSKAA